jgi:hypothetical protein
MKFLAFLGFLLLVALFLPVTADTSEESSSIAEWKEGYYPKYPLDPAITWEGNLTLEAGFPLVQHAFAPFSEKEWETFDIGKEHTIKIIAYENPPLFPNQTIYAIYHPVLETMPWLIEMKNSVTGDDMLAQVASTPKGKYDPQLTPLENDQNNNIGWYVVDGTLYPRTWISGHLAEGQTWVEYWGPFLPDQDGSTLRKRTYSIREEPVEFEGETYPGYIVRIVGPHVIANVPTETVEELTLVDGIGVTKRLLTHTAAEPFVRNSTITGKQTMPAGTMIFRHMVTMYSMEDGK